MNIYELLEKEEVKELFPGIPQINDFFIYILDEEKKIIFGTGQKAKIDFLLDKSNRDYKRYSHFLEDLYIRKTPFLTPVSTKNSSKFSIIGEPVITKDRVSAALIIYFPESFTGFARALAFLLKKHIERLVELNSELDNLTEEIVHNYEEFSILDDINKSIEGVLDQDRICKIVAEKAINLINGKRVAILIKSKENNHFEITYSQGFSNKDILKCKLNFKKGICGLVLKNGQSILINNPEQFLSIPDFENKKCSSCQICSLPFILSPLRSGEKIIGLIVISGKTKEKNFSSRDLKLLVILSTQAGLAISNAELFREREKILLQGVSTLVEAIEAKDPYSSGHSKRVAYYTECLCKELGLSEQIQKDIYLSSLLHDVGKIGISDEILLKPGKLTKEEYEIVQRHPQQGEAIVDHFTLMHDLMSGIISHHERYDGKGYPNKLKGDEIPLPAKIIAIADTFDALTSHRPYRSAFTPDEAISIMIENKGTQFDPHLLEAFVSCFKEGKIIKK
jgi:HD-GYP domain-containing protein (c-di-GMP phosphodiesterase class II)